MMLVYLEPQEFGCRAKAIVMGTCGVAERHAARWASGKDTATTPSGKFAPAFTVLRARQVVLLPQGATRAFGTKP